MMEHIAMAQHLIRSRREVEHAPPSRLAAPQAGTPQQRPHDRFPPAAYRALRTLASLIAPGCKLAAPDDSGHGRGRRRTSQNAGIARPTRPRPLSTLAA
jgi:hypothetical protein